MRAPTPIIEICPPLPKPPFWKPPRKEGQGKRFLIGTVFVVFVISVVGEWPRYCWKVCWTKMVQNGPNDHFGQNDLIPNWILAFARPKWTKMVHFGPFKRSILVHLGPPTVLWPFLSCCEKGNPRANHGLRKTRQSTSNIPQRLFFCSCPYIHSLSISFEAIFASRDLLFLISGEASLVQALFKG